MDSREESDCAYCLRKSPLTPLFGLIIVFLGGGFFSGGLIFARRFTLSTLDNEMILPYVDYFTYATLGITASFTLIGYIVCCVTASWNDCRYFLETNKTIAARGCALLLLFLLGLAIIFWVAGSCLLTYPIVNLVWLHNRCIVTDLWMSKKELLDLSYFGFYARNGQPYTLLIKIFMDNFKALFACYVITLSGAIFVILGYISKWIPREIFTNTVIYVLYVRMLFPYPWFPYISRVCNRLNFDLHVRKKAVSDYSLTPLLILIIKFFFLLCQETMTSCDYCPVCGRQLFPLD